MKACSLDLEDRASTLESSYRLIPDQECQINAELKFTPDAQICLAHFFKAPKVGFFEVGQNGNSLSVGLEGQSDVRRFYADDRLKRECPSDDLGAVWSLNEGKRAFLVGLTGRRFGCWQSDLGRVHVANRVDVNLAWIRAAMKATNSKSVVKNGKIGLLLIWHWNIFSF